MKLREVASFAWSLVAYALAIIVAAALFPSVAVTHQGVILAAALIAAPQALLGLALGDLARRWREEAVSASGCAFVVLAVLGLFLPLPLLILAAFIVPGVHIGGFWGCLATAALVLAMPFATMQPYLLVRRLRDG